MQGRIWIWLGKVCAAGITALVLLSVMSCFFACPAGVMESLSGATDYQNKPNSYTVDALEGFAVVHYDEAGFNNQPWRIKSPIDILLMGDSQMEATHVDQSLTPGSLLNDLLPSMVTYNIGLGRHHLYTIARNMRNAIQTYQPKKYVLVDAISVSLNAEDMRAVLDGTYASLWDPGPLDQIRKYLPATFRLWVNLIKWAKPAEVDAVVDDTTEEYTELLDTFLAYLAKPALENNVQPVIFYLPATSIDADGTLVFDTDQQALERFCTSCGNNGILFIDLTDDFQRLYEQQHKLPYGFANTQVGKGHMNPFGYRVLAERLSKELAGN